MLGWDSGGVAAAQPPATSLAAFASRLGLGPAHRTSGERIRARPPGVRHLALFHDLALPQILARRVAGHPCLHSTHADGSSLVALENEPGELGFVDHNPKQHPPPRPTSISPPNHPGKPPHQGSVLIVLRGHLSLSSHTVFFGLRSFTHWVSPFRGQKPPAHRGRWTRPAGGGTPQRANVMENRAMGPAD